MKTLLHKESLREKMLKIRHSLSEEFVSKASFSIQKKLLELECIKGSTNICGFHPLRGEPNIIPVLEFKLRQSANIYLPKFDNNLGCYKMVRVANFAEVKKGKFGIMEPIGKEPLNENSLTGSFVWLVPGLAFGHDGKRVGFGQGIYDYLLKKTSGVKIGVCFEFQISDSIVESNHDVRMDFVVTESKIYQNKNKTLNIKEQDYE